MNEGTPGGSTPNQEVDAWTPAPEPPVSDAAEPAAPPPPYDGPPPVAPQPPAPPAKAGRGRTILVIGAIVVFLGVVLFLVRNNVNADDLKVGDCFNIPNGTTISTVEKQPCTETHNAEVIFIGEYTGDSYPISLSLDSYLQDNCIPAFETYVGRPIDSEPELALAYFYPTRDGWDGGDRTITCYISQPDEGPMTESLKG
ncbi:MAG TPA: septum formation family protein [Candidatus Limnocylindrales bacterium]|nr:septum formation family protein [Candidatus Limnocylindrales bacterium]